VRYALLLMNERKEYPSNYSNLNVLAGDNISTETEA